MSERLSPWPMVAPDVDLTDFKFMPLEVARLRRSKAWLICKRRPALAFYMLNLWTASWHERPAGSLEDDDDVLADAAMCPPERWPEVVPAKRAAAWVTAALPTARWRRNACVSPLGTYRFDKKSPAGWGGAVESLEYKQRMKCLQIMLRLRKR
jgi:hypothetical protein